jgi:hypothetical protein
MSSELRLSRVRVLWGEAIVCIVFKGLDRIRCREFNPLFLHILLHLYVHMYISTYTNVAEGREERFWGKLWRWSSLFVSVALLSSSTSVYFYCRTCVSCRRIIQITKHKWWLHLYPVPYIAYVCTLHTYIHMYIHPTPGECFVEEFKKSLWCECKFSCAFIPFSIFEARVVKHSKVLGTLYSI